VRVNCLVGFLSAVRERPLLLSQGRPLWVDSTRCEWLLKVDCGRPEGGTTAFAAGRLLAIEDEFVGRFDVQLSAFYDTAASGLTISSPRSHARRHSVTPLAKRSNTGCETKPMCGVATTLGIVRNGWSAASGSLS